MESTVSACETTIFEVSNGSYTVECIIMLLKQGHQHNNEVIPNSNGAFSGKNNIPVWVFTIVLFWLKLIRYKMNL